MLNEYLNVCALQIIATILRLILRMWQKSVFVVLQSSHLAVIHFCYPQMQTIQKITDSICPNLVPVINNKN